MSRAISIIHGLMLAVLLTACNSSETLPDEPDWINNPGDGAVGSAGTVDAGWLVHAPTIRYR